MAHAQKLVFLLVCLGLAGCAENGGPRLDGAGPVIAETVVVSRVDLLNALDPENKGCWRQVKPSDAAANEAPTKGDPPAGQNQATCTTAAMASITPESPTASQAESSRNFVYRLFGLNNMEQYNVEPEVKRDRVRLERAFEGFYTYNNRKLRRDRLQATLILASNQNCAYFLQTLHGVQSAANFGLGSLATATAGAGAIVTGATAARSLAGTGAILSGIRAEMNEDYFRNIFSDALSKAIDIKRTELREEMLSKTNTLQVEQYPVETAIADAVEYNNQCSLVAGLSLISTSVNMSADPVGLQAFQSAFAKAGYQTKFGNIQISKMWDDTSARQVGTPARDAEAASGVEEIKGTLARVTSIANVAYNKITAVKTVDKTSDQGKTQTANIAKLKELVERFATFDDTAPAHKKCVPDNTDNKPTNSFCPLPQGVVQTLSEQIGKLKDEYESVTKNLSNTTTSRERDQINQILKANDYQAAQLMRVFRNAAEGTIGGIMDMSMAADLAIAPDTPPN